MGQEIIIKRLHRHQNWPLLLSNFIKEKQGQQFKWGSNDCILFAADCINTLTGVDLAASYRGTYDDRPGAEKILKGFGGVLSTLISSHLGQPSGRPLMARRGDIVIHDIHGICCTGVVDDTGRRVMFLTEGRGIIRLNLSSTMIVWGYG